MYYYYLLLCVCAMCIYVCVPVCVHMHAMTPCGDQGTTVRSWFCPPTIGSEDLTRSLEVIASCLF